MPGTAHRYEHTPNVRVGDYGIVVTVPKANKSLLQSKIDNVGDAFWVFQKTPKLLGRDCYSGEAIMYVVHDGEINNAFLLGHLEYGSREPLDPFFYGGHNPEVSKKGCRVWLEEHYKVRPPIKMKGFQGFRYIEPNCQKSETK